MKTLISALLTLLTFASCTSSWTEEEKRTFTQNCEASAVQATDSWPKETCACLSEKLQAAYPNPNDMAGLLDSLQQNPILLFDKYPECRRHANETPAEWNPAAEQAFLKSCDTLVKKGYVSSSAVCPCVLDKVKRRFPTVQRMQHLNSEVMGALAEECEGKRPARLY